MYGMLLYYCTCFVCMDVVGRNIEYRISNIRSREEGVRGSVLRLLGVLVHTYIQNTAQTPYLLLRSASLR